MKYRNVTWDTVNKGNNVILSNENLTARIPNLNNTVVASVGKKRGKWYWEISFSEYSYLIVGVSNKDVNLHASNFFTQVVRYYSGYNAYKYPEATNYGENYSINDVISVLLDLDNGTLEFWKNGVSQGISHNNIHLLGEVYPTVTSASSSGGGVATANFGANPFKYNMPSGYKAYNAQKKVLIQSKSGQYLSCENTIDRITAIPKMSSNTSPSGRAFAKDIYSTNYDAWYAFNQVDDAEGYASESGSGGVGFLGYEFGNPIAIAKYAVRSMAGSSHLNKLPRDWTFEGSHDGEKWHVLDTQKNQTWTTVNTDKDYYITYPKSFKMYRLNWTANNGHTGYTGINELKMYSGTSTLSHIPTINEKYFTEYGMDKLTKETFKNNYDKVRLVSNKEMKLDDRRTFEHEIDLKKYEVNEIFLQ
ncbi:hypothetical protein HFN20_13950 [Paenibacillus dendritiformis]|uniref:SPRY domain-containing protein n=1 Tax=Paenibacillus dendritiformis TaxID=130049 RepID=UPI00143D208C|nr:SPRY domain-containing protein [Paenibacillus dendritiformis]NKI22307.1 hypothetical protein [Paenibacillus dendritiformis]NRF99527.1 hypothetical protein [Paenibacillus dendritiformis]